MSVAAALSIASAALACYVAALNLRFSRVPAWRDQRWLAAIAFTTALYSSLNLLTTQAFPAPVLEAVSRTQMLLGVFHTYAWLRYSAALLPDVRARAYAWATRLLLACGVTLLLPGMFTGEIRLDVVALTGATYHTARTTWVCDATIALALSLLLVPFASFVRAARRGVPSARTHAGALAFLLATGMNDALVQAGLYRFAYLVDLGFLIPIAAVGYEVVTRFSEDARALQALRGELEGQVAARTEALDRAEQQLHRAEKLAALGQFAAGVAHEVNNPSAVVTANLRWLEESASAGAPFDGEARDAIRDSLLAMERIGGIVRQLLDAGRLAGSPARPGAVAVRAAAEEAIRVARARCGARVAFACEVGPDVHAKAQESVLVQVLVNLLVNGAHAVPAERRDGRVAITAETDGRRARITVEDNGAGMTPEVLRRVFEPFFTTKPFGAGTGLGLAVSRGLIASFGGDLSLESRPGLGTRAVVELRAGAPAASTPAGSAGAAGGPRRRLLLVDDEAAVRSSLRRLLEPGYEVVLAHGVDDGLERAAEGEFDALLCDLMMPGGGGERLWRTLRARDPALAARTVFFTGGAVGEDARRFLCEQPQPVLPKPLDRDALDEAIRRVEADAGHLLVEAGAGGAAR